MAYNYPPPFIFQKQNQPPFPAPLPDFSIPPPGFGSCELQSYQSQLKATIPETQDNVILSEIAKKDATEEMSSDQVWVNNWLQKRIKMDESYYEQHKQEVQLKVHEARKLLHLSMTNLEKLKVFQKELERQYHNLNSSSWIETLNHINSIKNDISDSLDKLQRDGVLDHLKRILAKRCKKRQRKKRQKTQLKELVAERFNRRQQLHINIDTWLKNMQEVVENAKREESLKHEADQVLSEVTRKKSEARRQINMLVALQKLRQIRAQTAKNIGQRVDAESGIRFAKVIAHLQKLWEDQLKGYNVEEQGLRVMLDEAVEERTKTEVTQNKKILSEWEALLFGKRGSYDSFYMAAEEDIEQFVSVRKSWDKFLVSSGAAMSSSIPIGWVLPSIPSSEMWESLVAKDNAKLYK